MAKPKITTRKTPNCRHPYTATAKGRGEYGWGNTPAEARAKLLANIAQSEAERKAADDFESGNSLYAASFAA